MINTENRGRPITCKICNHQFKHRSNVKREEWNNNKQICPKCNSTYITKPETERVLMLLQDKYFDSNRNEKYINQMIPILSDYCESLLKKSFYNKLTFEGSLEYYRDNTISFLIEEYYKNSNYKVWGSFKGAIVGKIKQSIFGKQEHSVGKYSLNYELEDGSLADLKSPQNVEKEVEELINKKLLCKYLLSLVEKLEERYSYREVYMMYFLLFLSYVKGRDKMGRYCRKVSKVGKWPFLKASSLIRQELRKNLD